MKSKKVLITAVVTVVVLTIALFAIVFSMQHAMAQKGAPVEDVPTEAVTEEPAETTESEIPEKTAKTEETEELPAELPEEAEAQPDELSEETEEAAEITEPAEEMTFEGELTISGFTQSQKKLKESEVVEQNWKTKEPSAADISKEQAIETAKHAGKEIFGLKDLEVKTAEFQKDMSGQRGSYWLIEFKEDELSVSVDSLSGNIARAYSEYRRSVNHEEMKQGEVSKVGNEIVKAEESEQGGEYTAATRAIAEKCIDGKVKSYSLNAVHGTGMHYPLVSIDVEMEDGFIYEFEWARSDKDAEIKICSMDAFPGQDHFRAWAYWDADLILFGDDPV